MIIGLYPYYDHTIKKRFLNDLFILIKNPENSKILIQSNDFYFWILESLLSIQLKFLELDNRELSHYETLLEFHSKLITSVI